MARIVLTVSNDLASDQRMHRIANSLARAGHQVLLVGRQLPESPPLPKRTFEQHRLRCWFRRGPSFYIEYNVRLCWLLLRIPVDAIGAVDLDTLLAACIAAQLRRKPLVFDAHEYFTETPEVIDRPWVKWTWEILARLCLPFCRRAYTVGPALANILTQRYGLFFNVVRNMPEPTVAPAAPARSDSPPYLLLYQGALNQGRGIEALLLAMTQLDDCQLWLAGKGDLWEALTKMAQQLHLKHRVRFLGRLSPEALRQLTPKAWLGLNLIEKRSQSYYYSLANKFFDYVQAGVPVLTMDFPEYRLLNSQYEVAYLLDELSPKAIVDAVKHLQHCKECYLALRQAALQARLEWTWRHEEPTLLTIWTEALTQN
ncbi:MAG: glycosyltransferase [Saprospiraceae bacterium]|nr:glycosyltransferase [Saprospiraceae bacterium]MDW8484011.1 glycosyltransferase [Saprospiraceae bacterium]